MSLFLQLTINGLIAGSIYALVSSGFSLIYSTNKFMHFAHSVSVVFSAYLVYTLFIYGGSLFLTFIPSVILSALFGLGIYRFVYYPLQKRKASNVILLIASISLLVIFQNIIQMIFGASVKSVGFSSKTLNFFGASITTLQIFLIESAIILSLGLFLFMTSTKLGRDMRAVSNNKELASIVGIDQRRVVDFSFLIGSFLGGLAGIFFVIEYSVTPIIGTSLIIKGFTGSVLGGITSVPASVLGSFLLGLVENYGVAFLPSGFKDAIAFALLFVFLLFKPSGLFGFKRGAGNG